MSSAPTARLPRSCCKAANQCASSKVVGRSSTSWLVYTYEKDSVGQVGAGARERDRLIRLDESSYTIEGGDGGQRTYWRVKEKS